MLATSGLVATSPNATASQVSASVSRSRRPAAAIHSTRPAFGRNPISSAMPMTSAVLNIVWIRLPTTCPVSSEARAIAIVRNRATMPSVMSVQTDTAVAVDPDATAITMMPGET